MKIAVLGIHCSGKSTIASILSLRLDLPFVTTDPINFLKFPYRPKTFRLNAPEAFVATCYSLSKSLFSKFSTFITDYDLSIQLAYCHNNNELINRIMTLLNKLPKYDIVILLNVNNTITVIYRAIERMRWGKIMLTTSWQINYYKFTLNVLEGWRKHYNIIKTRGRKIIELNVDELTIDEVIEEILNQL